ncbi:MAG: hypothetical protein QM426_04520 [Euryarchaeota archaeon]|nr:hypothetical protein [Euryarchaeota archaeon]
MHLRALEKTRDIGTEKNNLIIGIFETYSRKGIEFLFPQIEIHIKETNNGDTGKKHWGGSI